MPGMRWALLIATVAGVAIAAWVIGAVGFESVLAAAGSIGAAGFLAFVGCSVAVLALLGLACLVVTPDQPISRLPLFIWARTTREGATDVLPFAQFGGLLVGARTLIAGGLSGSLVYAALIADLTTEMASQLLFTLYGVAMLALRLANGSSAHDAIWPIALSGLAAAVAIMAAFAFLQGPMLVLAGRLGERMLPGSAVAMLAVRERLRTIYQRSAHVCAAFLLNLLAWIASGAGAWIALRFMGAEISLASVLTIESLMFTLRSVAFLVPGAVGLQEAAYALLGPVFGLPPDTALALSLLKRARDLALGIPAMLIWQIGESRRLLLADAPR